MLLDPPALIYYAAVKAKTVPLHTTSRLEEEDIELLLIHDLGTRWGEW
jgi:hypothetical protein